MHKNFYLGCLLAFINVCDMHGMSTEKKELIKQCAICLDTLPENKNLCIKLPCTRAEKDIHENTFHTTCIWKWAQETGFPTCPLCQKPITVVIGPEHIECLDPEEIKTIIMSSGGALEISRPEIEKMKAENVKLICKLAGGITFFNSEELQATIQKVKEEMRRRLQEQRYTHTFDRYYNLTTYTKYLLRGMAISYIFIRTYNLFRPHSALNFFNKEWFKDLSAIAAGLLFIGTFLPFEVGKIKLRQD